MSNDAHTLHMEHIFAAPQHIVFDYFTMPELMKSWFGPGGTIMVGAEIDLRLGGECRWHIRTTSGQLTYLYGTILALDPPKRIVLTHKWQGANDETVVTLEFIDLGHKTKLRLSQAGISDQTTLDLLNQGWAEPLNQLAERLTALTA